MGATNGHRRPPRPTIELLTPARSAGEAAAIAAALEQFLADTAPPPGSGARPRSRWQRAALEEGVTGHPLSGSSWGLGPR